MLRSFTLQYVITKVESFEDGLELISTFQLLFCGDDASLLNFSSNCSFFFRYSCVASDVIILKFKVLSDVYLYIQISRWNAGRHLQNVGGHCGGLPRVTRGWEISVHCTVAAMLFILHRSNCVWDRAAETSLLARGLWYCNAPSRIFLTRWKMAGIQQTSEEEPFAVEGKSALFTPYTFGNVTEFLDRPVSFYIYIHFMLYWSHFLVTFNSYLFWTVCCKAFVDSVRLAELVEVSLLCGLQMFLAVFLCYVDRASQYKLVNETNLVHNLFSVYFVSFIYNLYMFLTSPGASCVPGSQLYRITSTKCRTNTVVLPGDGHGEVRNM